MADSLQAQQPLLEREYHEGCPGCELERRKMSMKGPPKLLLARMGFVVLCNTLPVSSLFPFVYFMVQDFGIAKSETRIGTYAGFLGAALMFGRFLSSTHWGMLADKYGRKPILLSGTVIIVVFNTLFGFSTTYWLALSWRFLLGLLNGMLGPVRAYASEVCTKEYQALGLAMVGTMWGLGLIIGPAIGGYLAQPSDKYPSLFPSGSVFDRFPYALPCLCISAIAFFGCFVSFWLPVLADRGFANGISMSLVSLARAVGPACAGSLFSWAQERIDSWFLPGMWMVFSILNVIAVLVVIGTFDPILPRSLANPLPEATETWESSKNQKLGRASSFTLT